MKVFTNPNSHRIYDSAIIRENADQWKPVFSHILCSACFSLVLASINPLSANFIKCSNTLKQFVSKLPTNCLCVFYYFVGLALKGLRNKSTSNLHKVLNLHSVYSIQCIVFSKICFGETLSYIAISDSSCIACQLIGVYMNCSVLSWINSWLCYSFICFVFRYK